MSESTTLEEKKNNKNNSNKINWVSFGLNFASSLFYLTGGIIVISSVSLYTALVAESNILSILPDNKISKHDIFTNITKIYTGFPPSIKNIYKTPLTVDADNNDFIKSNSILDKLLDTDFQLVHYLQEIIFSMINKNYSIINILYGLAYKLPESLVFCVSMYISPLIWFLMFFVNIGLAAFYHLYHIGDYFNTKSGNGKDAKWNGFKSYYSVFSWFYIIMYAFFAMLPCIMSVLPIVVMLYSFLSPLWVEMTNKNTNKSFGFIDFLKDMLSYKRQVIMWLVSFILLKAVYINMGVYNTMTCFVAIVGLALFTSIYSQYIPPCITKRK
jgi:hypothetical protein